MAHLTSAGEIGEDGAARARSMPSVPKHFQQYLARPGSRPYCSAMPTQVPFEGYEGSQFLLDPAVWRFYDWSVSHCVLRGDNAPIRLS